MTKLKPENVLIVDDNYDMLELLQRNLKQFNFHTYKATSVVEAIEILKFATIHLLITDLQMPGHNGIELVKYTNQHFPHVPILVITGFPSVDGAVEAIQSGAANYLTKPFTASELEKEVENCLKKTLVKPNQSATNVESEVIQNQVYAGIVGRSKAFLKLVERIERVKDNRATVLISGESGTGKELVAKAIHYKGSFAQHPFIAVNCGAIAENLLESELFGYEKGAFTGATQTKEGYFQAANGGSIFLDEIATAPMSVQVKLLRALQEKEVVKVGGHRPEKVNLRIIAATNENLYKNVQEGSFREDLYYRLNVVDIEVPPLRQRKEDIEIIATNLLKKYATEFRKPHIEFSKEAMTVLTNYSWPGNVRELENLIQRSILMASSSIEIHHLPEHIKYPEPSRDIELKTLREVEKKYIQKVLDSVGNNKSKAAKILGIDRKTLSNKLD
ncbi:MAG: sigma-54 dependent transcriptional regulator [Flavobacteriaceae bacterium]|nr:sigma-54 dependent transcriptional regulator [Flavobacteriaceae bacterium]